MLRLSFKIVVVRKSRKKRMIKLSHHPCNLLRHRCIRWSKANMVTKMNVFDREVKRLQRDAAARLPDSNDFDYLHVEVGKILMDRVNDISSTRKFSVVVDLGSLAGNNAQLLQEREDITTLFQLELSEGMLTRDKHLDQNFRIKPVRIHGDEEFLPFAPESIDLFISNLSLHWVNDLPGVFKQVRQCLKPDGAFLGSMFGGDTLLELRSSFILAEQEREGGISNHVSPFTKISDIGDILSSSGFTLPTIDLQRYNIDYADPFVLMNDLRSMGESNATLNRRKFLKRETLMAAAAIYKELYKNENGTVPATFEVVFFIGWAPHESQPRPKRRGSATHSMKEFETGPTSEGENK